MQCINTPSPEWALSTQLPFLFSFYVFAGQTTVKTPRPTQTPLLPEKTPLPDNLFPG